MYKKKYSLSLSTKQHIKFLSKSKKNTWILFLVSSAAKNLLEKIVERTSLKLTFHPFMINWFGLYFGSVNLRLLDINCRKQNLKKLKRFWKILQIDNRTDIQIKCEIIKFVCCIVETLKVYFLNVTYTYI